MKNTTKTGWLVVNGFLKTQKFAELYNFFLNSAKKLKVEIQLVSSDSLVGEDFRTLSLRPDFVLFWDKDVCLAKRMESAGLVLFNNAHAVEVCDNKTLTALKLAHVVPMPQTLFSPKTFPQVGYNNLHFVEKACAILGLPMVIKEAYGSFGEQVYLAETLEQAKSIVQGLGCKDFLMQRFVAESCGRDIRLNVVGGKVVNAILRHSENDFRSNITLGGGMQPYTPTEREIAVAEKACQALGLDFAGVDVLFGKDGPLLCEINSNPHFKTTYLCTGVDLSLHILQHILDKLH